LKIRKLVKALLLIFVVLSFAVFIYKEFSPKSESNVTAVAATQGDKTSVSEKSLPVPESQPSKEPATKRKEKAPSPLTEVKSQNSKVIAYYFHGTFRCSTCQTIEKYSHDAIYQYFPKELSTGKLEFKAVNVEEGETRHYIKDYKLFSKSLIIALYKDDKEVKWKNLKEVWIHAGDKEKFYQYVKDEVEGFLKEAQ
jgi:hypothetical protein